MIDDRNATKPRNMSFKSYRKLKMQMLDDFGIVLSDKEIYHLFTLTKEIELDNFCINMIKKYL